MIALFVMIVLSLLGVALLTLSGTESNIAYNALWSEGAFAAAEAGIQTGLSQLSANAATSVTAIPVTNIGTGTYTYQFWSGHRDTTPQSLVFKGVRIESGYSIAIGTGYNPSGYTFNSYLINASASGPRNAQREIETMAEYGPVAQ
jgi:Tfp pilus assembly protein PilX